MFTVSGFYQGVPYAVDVAADGTVSGSPRIADLLASSDGERVAPTPTHGFTEYRSTSPTPETVLMALRSLTTVTGERGNVPDVTADDDVDDVVSDPATVF